MPSELYIAPREVCARLNISRGTFYNRINAGEITAVKNGSRTFVTAAELERYCRSLPTIQPRNATHCKVG